MTTWIAMIAVGLGSFAFRAVPLFLGRQVAASPAVERTIRHGGTAALTALVVSSVDHGVTAGPALPFGVGVAIGLAVALRGRSMLHVVAAGGLGYGAVALLTGVLS